MTGDSTGLGGGAGAVRAGAVRALAIDELEWLPAAKPQSLDHGRTRTSRAGPMQAVGGAGEARLAANTARQERLHALPSGGVDPEPEPEPEPEPMPVARRQAEAELVHGFVHEGNPLLSLDGVYAPAGEWDGLPLYKSTAVGSGVALYWCRVRDTWIFTTAYTALTEEQKKTDVVHAYRKSDDGRVPVGVFTWQCVTWQWVQDRPLTVRPLASADKRNVCERVCEEAQAAVLVEELPLVHEIFAAFDINDDGKLSKDEYKSYLKGIALWGKNSYTDEKWGERTWPKECENMGCTVNGITKGAFRGTLYGKHCGKHLCRFRMGKAQADLDSCKLMWADSDAEPEPEPEPADKPSFLELRQRVLDSIGPEDICCGR